VKPVGWQQKTVSERVSWRKVFFFVELLNGPVTGDSSDEHRANSGRFYNQAEGLIVIDSRTLSETSKDPTSLVVIKGPVSTELVLEDPLTGDNIGALRSGN
jgi:hypothetical protein